MYRHAFDECRTGDRGKHLRDPQRIPREAGIATAEDLAKIVQTMERFGFARRLDEESFVFEVAIYRFLDLCMEMAAHAERQQDATAQAAAQEESEA